MGVAEARLKQARTYYVGLVFRHGLADYEIVAVDTPKTHASPGSFGSLIPEDSYLIEVKLTKKRGNGDMPSCLYGCPCYFRRVR